MQSLSNIIVLELRSNIDFLTRLQENIKFGVYRVPESFMYHIANKYSMDIEDIRKYEPQIIDFVAQMFAQPKIDTGYKRTITVTKKKVITDIPAAKFQN